MHAELSSAINNLGGNLAVSGKIPAQNRVWRSVTQTGGLRPCERAG